MKFSIEGELFVPGVLGEASAESSEYMRKPRLIWRRSFMQTVRFAFAFALLSAGNNNAARMAMMAITTNNSSKENPAFFRQFLFSVDQTVQSPPPHAPSRPQCYR